MMVTHVLQNYNFIRLLYKVTKRRSIHEKRKD